MISLHSRCSTALATAALLVMAATPRVGRAQATLTAADAQVLRTALLGDLEVMRDKFLQLAEAFPQDKYTWRPMEGVRSVSDVLMLSALEGYRFIPRSFGGTPADLGAQEEVAKLAALTDKTQVMEQMRKGFAHAKQQLETIDPAALGATRNLFGADRSGPGIALFVFGDLHEHLGQLIAYARMNRIVPPWSK